VPVDAAPTTRVVAGLTGGRRIRNGRGQHDGRQPRSDFFTGLMNSLVVTASVLTACSTCRRAHR
jgi:hypothetical protein